MNIRLFATLALMLLVCSSCGPRPQGGGPRTDEGVISRAELNEVDVRTAYEAIERLRPRWLMVRGGPRSFSMETEVVVFQDEAYLGGLDALRRIGKEGIYWIRHLDGSTASATLPGMSGRHLDGAIVISMRPDRE